VRITVGDDGPGFDRTSTPVGLGLAGMQERAAILLGQLTVESEPGIGTTVELLLPVSVEAEPAGSRGSVARRIEGLL
jgi:signal transduction histidine kinase